MSDRSGPSKPTNPKDAVGIRKAPASCVPRAVVQELAVAMLEGARKYGRHNYRRAGVRASVYFDAANRHLDAWWEGEDIDPDTCVIDPATGLPDPATGVCHITKAIASLTVLRDSMIRGNWTDDRPPKMDPGWLADLNRRAGAVLDRLPEAVAAVTALDEPPPSS